MTAELETLLAELERLDREATPGPWRVNTHYSAVKQPYYENGQVYIGMTYMPMYTSRYVESDSGCVCSTGPHPFNVESIAAARNSLPTLIATIRTIAAENQRLRDALAEIAELPSTRQDEACYLALNALKTPGGGKEQP